MIIMNNPWDYIYLYSLYKYVYTPLDDPNIRLHITLLLIAALRIWGLISKTLSPRPSMWPGWQSSGTLQLEACEFGASPGIPQRTNPAGKLCASISF